jgi:hypothetical protein
MSYTFKRICSNSYSDLQSIFKSAFGKSPNLSTIKAKFNTNFTNIKNVGFIAYDDSFPAAYYGVYPLMLKIGNQRIISSQSGDTMVHMQHQGKGLFISLAKTTYSLCKDIGIKVVFGFPSKSSSKGFFKKLDWVQLGNLKKFDFLIFTFPISLLVSKFSFFESVYINYLKFVFSFYKKGNYFDGSPHDSGYDGVERCFKFWNYKLSNTKIFLIQINNTDIVLKIDGALRIGDINLNEKSNLRKILLKLKLLAFISGNNRIVFYTSSETNLEKSLSKSYQSKVGLPIGALSFENEIYINNLKFTYFDFDTF